VSFFAIIALALSILFVCFLIWSPIVVIFGRIVKLHPIAFRAIKLTNLSEIIFHYHSAVGFSCTWEFVSRSGRGMTANSNGIDKRFLGNLEKNLKNFSIEQFYSLLEDDFDTSIVIWRAA
jgi:hypothetical protein